MRHPAWCLRTILFNIERECLIEIFLFSFQQRVPPQELLSYRQHVFMRYLFFVILREVITFVMLRREGGRDVFQPDAEPLFLGPYCSYWSTLNGYINTHHQDHIPNTHIYILCTYNKPIFNKRKKKLTKKIFIPLSSPFDKRGGQAHPKHTHSLFYSFSSISPYSHSSSPHFFFLIKKHFGASPFKKIPTTHASFCDPIIMASH